MIPAAFDYVRAESVDHALHLLAEHGDACKVLAGGHSLLPLMKLRLATPALLVDVGRLGELDYVHHVDGELAIGALTRYRTLETSPVLASSVPIMSRAAHLVGDPQVRHRGTLGGALAHGDAAGDLPAVVLALGGQLVARSLRGERRLAATGFFTGFLETALAPDELLVEVRVPEASGGWSFRKLSRRAQDWAIVGVALARPASADTPGVALVNAASTTVRAGAVEAALRAGASAAEAAEHAADGLDPPSDLHASSEYRAHLARVLVRRALEEAGWS